MSDQSKQDQIAALERQLAELRGDDLPPYTLAELRGLSLEDVQKDPDRVARSLASVAGDGARDTSRGSASDVPAPVPVAAGTGRIANAYANRAANAAAGDDS